MSRATATSRKTRGSTSAEAILIIPAFLIFLAFIVGIGRTALLSEDLHAAGIYASRMAVTQHSSLSGETVARKAITDQLGDRASTCRGMTVSVSTGDLDYPAGKSGKVIVEIWCVVDLEDLVFPHVPGATTISIRIETPIDTYKQR